MEQNQDMNMAGMPQYIPLGMTMNPGMAHSGPPISQYPEKYGSPKLWRGLKIDNLPPGTTSAQILNYVTTGLVECLIFSPNSTSAEVRLLNYTSAAHLYVDWQLHKPHIRGRRIHASWVCAPPVDPKIVKAVAEGATRNLYVSNFKNVSERELEKICKRYGPWESLQIKQSRQGCIAFVHFLSISSALDAAADLENHLDCTVNFGYDRCTHVTKYQKQLVALYIGQKYNGNLSMDHQTLTNTLAQMATAAMAVAVVSGGSANVGNRSVVLSGVDESVSLREICNAIRGGLIESVSRSNNQVFVTFVEPLAAAQFFATWNLYQMKMYGRVVQVDWARQRTLWPSRHSRSKATRNVYIGGTGELDIDKFSAFMSQYGTIEQLNIVPERDYLFVNFTDIDSAISAIEGIRQSKEYSHLIVRYAKDRCCAPPKVTLQNQGPIMLSFLASCNYNCA